MANQIKSGLLVLKWQEQKRGSFQKGWSDEPMKGPEQDNTIMFNCKSHKATQEDHK